VLAETLNHAQLNNQSIFMSFVACCSASLILHDRYFGVWQSAQRQRIPYYLLSEYQASSQHGTETHDNLRWTD